MKIYTDSVKLLRTFFIETILILLLIGAIFFSTEWSNANLQDKVISFSFGFTMIVLLSYMVHKLLGIINVVHGSTVALLNNRFVKESIGARIFICLFAGFFIAIVGTLVEAFSLPVILGSQKPEAFGFPFKYYIIEGGSIVIINLLINIGIFGLVVFIYSKFHPPNSSS